MKLNSINDWNDREYVRCVRLVNSFDNFACNGLENSSGVRSRLVCIHSFAGWPEIEIRLTVELITQKYQFSFLPLSSFVFSAAYTYVCTATFNLF